MLESVVTALSSVLLSGAFLFLARNWLSERLRQSIQHEYAQKLEAHKASLRADHEIALERLRTDASQARAIHDMAAESYLETRRASHERRLQAIEAMWQAVRRIRTTAPSIVILQDILLPEEYPKIFTGEVLSGVLDGFSHPESFSSVLDDHEAVEANRPFMGEYASSLFFVYRAIVGRLLVLILFGKQDGKIVHWTKDSGVRQLLEAVCTADEVDSLFENPIGGVARMLDLVETKILEAASSIISGEEASAKGIDHAKKIMATATDVKAQEAKERLEPN